MTCPGKVCVITIFRTLLITQLPTLFKHLSLDFLVILAKYPVKHRDLMFLKLLYCPKPYTHLFYIKTDAIRIFVKGAAKYATRLPELDIILRPSFARGFESTRTLVMPVRNHIDWDLILCKSILTLRG